MINEFEKNLYTIVSNKEFISLDELAIVLNKSPRTVRFYIKELNSKLDKSTNILYSRTKSGYYIKKEAIITEITWFSENSKLPDTQEERVSYIIYLFLIFDGYVKILDLSESLYVSTATINNDIKAVKDYFRSFNIFLKSKPHFGLFIEYDEINCRNAIESLIRECKIFCVNE